MAYGLLIDITQCIGCGACVTACQEINGLPEQAEPKELDYQNFTVLDQYDETYVRRLCRHCHEPACESVCPVGALEKMPEGPVNYDETKCIGCRYCLLACPFEIPKYEWHSNNPRVRKCTMCYEQRTSKGKPTACSEACPTGATLFGDYDELLAEAHKRMKENPDTYVQHIYGEKEIGGTGVIFLSSIPFDKLGFKKALGETPLPEHTWRVISRLPEIVVTAGAVFSAVYWITHRREDVRRFEESAKHSNDKSAN